jgi:hypothetical protein
MPINIQNYWVFILIAIVILFISGFNFYRIIIRPLLPKGKNTNTTLPEKLPIKGFEVPIVDAYGGIKDLDRATFTQNFQKPRLILFEDHLDYKLFFRRSAKYSDILEVNCGSEFMLYFLQFTFNNRTLVLNVTMGNEQLYQQIKEFLSAKGVMVIEQV